MRADLLEELRRVAFLLNHTCGQAEMHARGTEVPEAREMRAAEIARWARDAWDLMREILPELEVAIQGAGSGTG